MANIFFDPNENPYDYKETLAANPVSNVYAYGSTPQAAPMTFNNMNAGQLAQYFTQNQQAPALTPQQQQPQQQLPDWASTPPAWLSDMQTWWQGMQNQQQAPASYTSSQFPQYSPNYANNALMRPVTQGSSITAQNQYGNMGYNNQRSTLWGDW